MRLLIWDKGNCNNYIKVIHIIEFEKLFLWNLEIGLEPKRRKLLNFVQKIGKIRLLKTDCENQLNQSLYKDIRL